MVEKVDGILFLDFVLNLGLSLELLCSSFYGVYVGHFTYEDMHIPMLVSMTTLLIMLPPLAALHSKATVPFIVLYIVCHAFLIYNNGKKAIFVLTGTQHC